MVMISSLYDVLFLDLNTSKEIDIDNEFNIGDIQSIIYHNHSFFILVNKNNNQIGYFLIEFDENPSEKELNYIINQKSDIIIREAKMHITEKNQDNSK